MTLAWVLIFLAAPGSPFGIPAAAFPSRAACVAYAAALAADHQHPVTAVTECVRTVWKPRSAA